ncbi:putative helicase mov-10-B.2 [Sinocyclocheilus anshuiensis]|uniref:putative helicase mov-10-B.2 n=1 Tax=Sinocyclocheilus anshuiensis TaxID=1608454 RepID=UPI0007B83617|nr:PREDICTED: putative helicase mov-10-B.2 [Sinocyclocheilus anshuiensis]
MGTKPVFPDQECMFTLTPVSLLQSPLGFHNYAERFDLLLYLEECQMHVDIKRYNKDQVTLLKDYDKRLMVLNTISPEGRSPASHQE